MSAVLGVFGVGSALAEEQVRSMLGTMSHRGSRCVQTCQESGALLSVGRHEWEMGRSGSGPVLVAEDGDVVVVADATLYYQQDLIARLAQHGVAPKEPTPSHLILAAYRAFGDRCAEFLEGDFAFLLWDRSARRVIAARDFAGSRPLYFAELDGGQTLVLASSLQAILAHPACSPGLDLPAIALDAAKLTFSIGDQTAYRGVRRLDAGMTLSRPAGSRFELRRHWVPPVGKDSSPVSFDQAAEELRSLLRAAVAERLDPHGTTAMWLSGGWDSTAVFASGRDLLSGRGEADRLVPISMTLPDHDPMCETDRIKAAAERWRAPVRWLSSESIPLFTDLDRRVPRLPEPHLCEYEMVFRAMARETLAVPARVALTGHGGDFLFQVSNVFLADLLRTGRWIRLAREWRAIGPRNLSGFLENAVAPLLTREAGTVLATLWDGRRFGHPMERPVPTWFDQRQVGYSELEGRATRGVPSHAAGSRVAGELYWYLTNSGFSRILAETSEFGLEEGVEQRYPLLDRRVVEFAVRRPWEELRSRGETKRLLRHAMRDLLPPAVLARREIKTGSMGGYLDRCLPAALPFLRSCARDSVLGAHGIIRQDRFHQAVEELSQRLEAGREIPNALSVGLLATGTAERWLRSRTDDPKENDFVQSVPARDVSHLVALAH